MEWEIVMGLEVHTELATKTKIFCGCSTEFGGDANTHVCEICSGLPGTLPLLNERVVEFAVRTGIATNCEITRKNKFDRKNYFYPDLPKAYQISQLYFPICRNGYIEVKDENGNIIPNGRYENGKMTFYTDTFGKFTIEYNPKSFTDLGNHAWASEAITRLAARGIINGITATTYGPARNITRADFTTLIVRAFGFEGEVASFADVPANAYYAEPVGIAKTLGIVGGVNESDFAPTAEITRQDMMVIVARALDKAGYVLDASDSPAFSDTSEVADYAKDAVQMLTASGIIAGSNGKINPKGKTTRAEVAVILDPILFMDK